MKIMKITFIILLCILGKVATAQLVKDPLLDYYQRISSIKPSDGPKAGYALKTQIYTLEADFTGDGRKSVFITDELGMLGPHGDYGWAVYVPTNSGYNLISDGGIDARLQGPDYIGYINEIKHYGIITGGRDTVTAQYLENGSIKMAWIDQERGHSTPEFYPKYFNEKAPDYHITTYTMEQLKQRYPGVAKSLPSPSVPPEQIAPPSPSPTAQAPIPASSNTPPTPALTPTSAPVAKDSSWNIGILLGIIFTGLIAGYGFYRFAVAKK